MNATKTSIDWQKGGGLVPAVVQHAVTGRVLMLGYMNAEAFETTKSTGRVTFYSRSRQCLWTKGETSGNRLVLRDIETDCDADAILLQAVPTGRVCHLDKDSCFDREESEHGFGIIGRVEKTIDHRIGAKADGSYTAQLVHAGAERIAKKVGEEGVELALAATRKVRGEIIAEAADLVYHVLVMLRDQGMDFADVASELDARHRCGSGRSGES